MTILGALMGFLLLSGGPVPLLPSANAAAAPARPTYAVTLTAYNAVPEQTDDDPFTTAAGVYANPEVVAARSRDLAEELPFGTIIEIDGSGAPKGTCGYGIVAPLIGYRVIADTMNARYSRRVDILFSTKANYPAAGGIVKNAGTILGICDGVTVSVVGRIDISNPNKLPKTQAELAARISPKNGFALK